MFNRKKKKIEELNGRVVTLTAGNNELLADIRKWDSANKYLHETIDLLKAARTICERERDTYKAQAKKTRVEVADDILKAGIHLEPFPDDNMVYGMMMRIPGWDLRNEEDLIKELQWLVAYHVHKGKQGDPHVQPEKKPVSVAFTPRVERSIVGTALFDDTEHFAKGKSGGDPYGVI